jgi:hypothetical protein
MKLIDRYVYAVTERLPEDTREDVSRELHANIEDMLPENPTESDVRLVLEELGNPMKLADEYSPNKKYLIGPGLYDSYFSVLKLVIGIVASVLVGITLLEWAFDPPVSGKLTEMSIQFFVNMVVTVIQGVLQSSLWVTVVFAVLERSGVNEGKIPFVKKKWSLDDLPTIPVSSKRKISRVETVFSMFCTVLFTALLYFQPQLIAIYRKGDNGITEITPLFMIQRLHSYIIIIFIIAIIQLGIFTWKFISMHWSIPLAVANAILNTVLCIFLIVILSDNSLFNHEFLSKISEYTKVPLSEITSIGFRNSIWISIAAFIAISLWDSVAAFIKCKK